MKGFSFATAGTVLLVLGSCACAEIGDGLVAYYTCNDAAGAALGDRSGHGNNGVIRGAARWVKGPFGSALGLNGEDAYVDCGVKPGLNISRRGAILLWFRPIGDCQGGLVGWTKGAGDLNQRLVLSLNTLKQNRSRGELVYKELGLYMSDGRDFERPFISNFHEAFFPSPEKWLFYAVTFDGRQLDIYLDGVLTYTRFQNLVPDLTDASLWLGRCAGMGGSSDYFKGLLDEVRIYNRALSEQEVHRVYMQSAAGRGKDTSGFGSIGIKLKVCPKPGTIFADLDYRGLQAARPSIKADLLDAQGKSVVAGKIRMTPVWGRAEGVFNAQSLPAGNYVLRATADTGQAATASVEWPGREKGWERVKVLNNFCWELLNESPVARGRKDYTFHNPRRGWVWFLTEAQGETTLSVSAARPAAVRSAGRSGVQEAMRWLPEGEHQITVSGSAALTKLVVRSVPALLFIHYPHVGPGTGNDHEFLVRNRVLENYNALLTGDYGATYNRGEFRQKWASDMGRHVFEERYTGPLAQAHFKDATVRQQMRDHLVNASGLNKAEFQGVFLDEFDPGDDMMRWIKSYYDEWIEVCGNVMSDPQYATRFIVPWFAYNMFDFRKSSAFLRLFVKHGSFLANEVYLDERDSEGRALLHISEALADRQDDWERSVPGVTEHMLIGLSYLQREYWNPAVNYKVFQDMQFQHLATRPEFFGLAGVGCYQSHQSTEEYVRWVSKLCRHYGLEGHTDRLSTDPYNLAQVRNGDFLDGTAGWTLESAEANSMAVKSHKGYGTLQERYPYRPWTDCKFLWTKRSTQKPNVFSQQIRNLQAGRLYLVRMWIGDYNELTSGASKDQERAVNLRVEGGDVWNDWYRTALFKGNVYTFASWLMSPFNGQNRYYFKVHQLIFRARGSTARLSISDWRTDQDPGGPVGQELIFNNIDVHPYLEP